MAALTSIILGAAALAGAGTAAYSAVEQSSPHLIDAVDDVIDRVLTADGQVAFVGKAVLEDYQHIALIYH